MFTFPCTFAQEYHDYIQITEKLIALDFIRANNFIKELPEKEEQDVFLALKNILYHQGQERTRDSIAIGKLKKYYKNEELNLASRMASSYYQLYYFRNSEHPIAKINSTYLISKRSKIYNFRKLAIRSFLILYSRENTLSLADFNSYLEEYQKLAESPNDIAWVHYYTNFFDGMSASFPERYEASSTKLYELVLQDKGRIEAGVKNYLYQNVALNFRVKNQLDSAEVYLTKIASSLKDPYNTKLKFITYLELGLINTKRKNLKKAKEYFKKAKLFFDKNDTLYSSVLYNRYLAFNYFEPIGKYDDAYKYLKKSRLDEAQLNYKLNNLKVSELNTKLRTAEKEKQILIEKERATTNRNWLIAAGLALLFGAGIAILLQKNTAKKRKLAEQGALLEQQKVKTLLKEQELVSIDAMIAGQEKERTKVANELHDDLGSLMATVKLHFDNVKVDEKDPAMKNAQDLLEKAYQKIRGMAHAKNSGVMANQGLLPAVKKMAKTISETNTLKVTVEDFGLADRMENSLELTIFRILQELVANVIKHANATEVNIQFTQHEDKLNIIVEDNGNGFEMGKVKTVASGMGLTTIEKRIEHLEGTFTVDSILGKGTSILIDIPV